jgi:tRNA threonylcarbamoyladenosine biosynthesis protein TsaE
VEWIIRSESELSEVANWVIEEMASIKIFLLEGDLGAGKTTLVKYICQALKVKDVVQSPTFSIIHEYQFQKPQKGQIDWVYHMDLYRIKTLEEAYEIGIEDYLYDEHACLIEWPNVIFPILPDQFHRIMIETTQNEQRKIRILKHLQ